MSRCTWCAKDRSPASDPATCGTLESSHCLCPQSSARFSISIILGLYKCSDYRWDHLHSARLAAPSPTWTSLISAAGPPRPHVFPPTGRASRWASWGTSTGSLGPGPGGIAVRLLNLQTLDAPWHVQRSRLWSNHPLQVLDLPPWIHWKKVLSSEELLRVQRIEVQGLSEWTCWLS